jgi:hypothetical protein
LVVGDNTNNGEGFNSYVTIMKYLFLFLLLILGQHISTHAQTIPDLKSLVSEEFTIYTFKVEKEEKRTKITDIEEHEVVITFNEGFSDSVKAFVDDSLYLNSFIKSDHYRTGNEVAFFKIDFKKIKKRRVKITFILPQEKRYISFNISRGHKLLQVNRTGSEWLLRRTNNVLMYE